LLTDKELEPDLLTLLDILAKRIHPPMNPNQYSDSMIERYNFFITHSEFGKDCTYARKCKDIFLREDYEQIKQIFLDTLVQFRMVEGNQFGCLHPDRSDKIIGK
jgi:hypothetical protein